MVADETPHVTMSDECGDHGGTNRDGDPCGQSAGYGTDFDSGKCKHHRGTNADGSSHEDNDWAATHRAYSDSFVEDFLRDDEIERVKQFEELTGTIEGTQEIARTTAGIALEQFRRSGDDRFLRRYESICDTFGIAPADELELSGNVDGTTTHSFDEDTAAAIREATLQEETDE